MRWPEIPRPWNPAYKETYEAMTPRERVISARIDYLVFLMCCGFVMMSIGGCAPMDGGGATEPSPVARGGTSQRHEDIERAAARAAGVEALVIDRETGCQYIGYTHHGLTPRMGSYDNMGTQYHVGCYIDEGKKR